MVCPDAERLTEFPCGRPLAADVLRRCNITSNIRSFRAKRSVLAVKPTQFDPGSYCNVEQAILKYPRNNQNRLYLHSVMGSGLPRLPSESIGSALQGMKPVRLYPIVRIAAVPHRRFPAFVTAR